MRFKIEILKPRKRMTQIKKIEKLSKKNLTDGLKNMIKDMINKINCIE